MMSEIEQPRTYAERWIYAVKIKSWPKVLGAAALGSSLGATQVDSVASAEILGLLYAASFLFLDVIYIVLINDWADQRVDKIKRQLFPEGCSPKTIPDDILPARSVHVGGLLAAVGCVVVAWLAEATLERAGAVFGALLCLGMFAVYSLPPVRLNYRGGGEFAEALGVGLVLPLFIAYLGFGVAPNRDSVMLASGHGLLALASALASGLSDEVSDRLGGKRTCATIFGSAATRRSIEILLVLGGFACCATPYFTELPSWIGTPAGLFVLYAARGVRRASPFAVTNAFRALGTYKARLHECIWGGTALLTTSLWAYSLWVR